MGKADKVAETCCEENCWEPVYARSLCHRHYFKGLREGKFAPYSGSVLFRSDDVALRGSSFMLRPARPKRVTDELHKLAEAPNLTLPEYERAKRQILERFSQATSQVPS